MGELEPGFLGGGDPFGQPAEECLGALLDPERALAQLATDLLGRFADSDVGVPPQRDRRREPGDPAADDENARRHLFSEDESSS